MAGKSALTVVSTPPGRPVSIKAAAASGSRRSLLVAMRDRVAEDLDQGVAARDLASLTRRLLEIAKEIDALDAAEKGDDVGRAAVTPDDPWSG